MYLYQSFNFIHWYFLILFDSFHVVKILCNNIYFLKLSQPSFEIKRKNLKKCFGRASVLAQLKNLVENVDNRFNEFISAIVWWVLCRAIILFSAQIRVLQFTISPIKICDYFMFQTILSKKVYLVEIYIGR